MPIIFNNNIDGFLHQMYEVMLLNKQNNSTEVNLWWINSWFYTYSSLILLTFVITIIFLIGLFIPKTPRGVSVLNVLSALSIFLFLYFLPLPHYNVIKHLAWFDYNLYVYIYIILGGLFTATFLAMNNEITFLKENKHIEYPVLILLVFLFGVVVVAAENFIAVFLALEAITLISAVLIGFQRSNNLSTLAGVRYILFSAVPGGALLLGISEIYAYTGAFNFSDIEKLLITFNEQSIQGDSLIAIQQVLYNTLDTVLFYNWDVQFNSYVEALNNQSEVTSLIHESYANTLFTLAQSNAVLEEVLTYNLENPTNINGSNNDVILYGLGSFLLQQTNDFDLNIKTGKYFIYEYISNNSAENYFSTQLMHDEDFLNAINKEMGPLYGTIQITELPAGLGDRYRAAYPEIAAKGDVFIFRNIKANPALIIADFMSTTGREIMSMSKELTSLIYTDEKYFLQQKIHPSVYSTLLQDNLMESKFYVWSFFYEDFVMDVVKLHNRDFAAVGDFVMDTLKARQASMAENIAYIQNNFLNEDKTSFVNPEKGDNSWSESLSNFYYNKLLQNHALVSAFIAVHQEDDEVKEFILYDLLKLSNNNDFARFMLFEVHNELRGYRIPNIYTVQDYVNLLVRYVYHLDSIYAEKFHNYVNGTVENFHTGNVGTEEETAFCLGAPIKFSPLEWMDKDYWRYRPPVEFEFKAILPKTMQETVIKNNYNNFVEAVKNADNVFNANKTLNLISTNHLNNSTPTIITISIFLIIFYILFKLTAAPFHAWAPSIYEGAPLPVTIFLSIFSKITLIFLLIKILNFYFYFLYSDWSSLLLFCGIGSILVGIYGAISETRIKRFFIYSSMGHVGFMILGIAEGGLHGVLSTLTYLIIYTITVFIGWLILYTSEKNITHINQLRGLSKTNPTLSFILAISMLSMSGIPPLAGFFVKFEILYALIESEYYNIGLLALFLTVCSFFYYLRVIKILYFEPIKKYELSFKLNKTQAFILAICFLFLINFVLYLQQPIFYLLKNIVIQSLY